MNNEEKLAHIVEEMEDLQARYNIAAEALFKESIDELFNKYPRLNAISWHQYTPFFNDGAPCEFGVSSPGVQWSDVAVKEDYYGDGFIRDISSWEHAQMFAQKYGQPIDYPEDVYRSCDDVEKILYTVGENFLKNKFDDHVEVTITRDSTEVHDFDHD